jgi:hypothetical protein
MQACPSVLVWYGEVGGCITERINPQQYKRILESIPSDDTDELKHRSPAVRIASVKVGPVPNKKVKNLGE